MHIDYRRVMVGVLAFSVFTYEGFRQMYRAKHVDRLEREGKIPADVAARIRKKPMRLIGWGGVCVGIAFLLQSIFSWP
jgi:predicted anti-sigma-YlaC factor YlaD